MEIQQHEIPDELSKAFLSECLSVMSYELCCHGNRYYHIVFITRESLGFSIISSS